MDDDKTRQIAINAAKRVLIKQLGDSGVLVRNGGLIDPNEYNRDLTGTRGLDKYNEMRRSDPDVKLALMAVMLPVLSVDYFVKPASEDPRAMRARQIVHDSFFEQMDFYDFARQALTFLPLGHSMFEQEMTVGTSEGKECVLLKDLHYRRQQNIIGWTMRDGKPGITYVKGDGEKVDLPLIKLSRFTYQQEGDNWVGESLLRPAYKPWYLKTAMELTDSMVIEKQGLGVLKISVPQGAKKEDKDDAEEIAKEQRANESNFIMQEGEWNYDFMDMQAGTLRDPNVSIGRLRRAIYGATMTQFLDIGSSDSSGSFAASDNQLSLFLMAEQSIAREFTGPLNKTAVPNICMLNSIEKEFWPTLENDRIGKDSIAIYSEALSKLFTSGIITPDPEIEENVRRFLHLPPLTEDMIKNYDQIRALRRAPGASPAAPVDPSATEANDKQTFLSVVKQARDSLRDLRNARTKQ